MNQTSDKQPAERTSSVWKNFGHLVSGRLVSAILTLLATACMARALGPKEFGLVVLMHTYVLTVRALLNLKPAETFVRFGVPLIDLGKKEEVGQLLGLIRSFEWVTMLIATAIAVMAAPLVGPWLGMPDNAIAVLMAYSLVLLTSPVGTARGFCRAVERFDVLRRALAIGPAVRLCCVLLAWQLGASWEYFALAWGASLGVSYLFLWIRGSQLIRASGYQPQHLAWSKANTHYPGLSGFIGVVYVQGILDQLPRQLITLLIGGFLGAASAGLYRVAREIADVLAKPVQMIRQAAFTEITRLGEQGSGALSGLFRRYGLRLLLPALALVGLASLFREELLTAVGGPDYAQAGLLLVLLLVAAAIELVGAVLRPLAYAHDKATTALRVQLAAMATYLGLFVALQHTYGLVSVGVAAIAAAIVTLSSLGFLVWRWSRRDAAL